LILIFDPNKMVITQQIPLLRGQYHVDWGLLSAGTLIAMSVPLLVFVFLQRYFVRGLIGGAVK
jgi:multiple sugar transport system permease protein